MNKIKTRLIFCTSTLLLLIGCSSNPKNDNNCYYYDYSGEAPDWICSSDEINFSVIVMVDKSNSGMKFMESIAIDSARQKLKNKIKTDVFKKIELLLYHDGEFYGIITEDFISKTKKYILNNILLTSTTLNYKKTDQERLQIEFGISQSKLINLVFNYLIMHYPNDYSEIDKFTIDDVKMVFINNKEEFNLLNFLLQKNKGKSK